MTQNAPRVHLCEKPRVNADPNTDVVLTDVLYFLNIFQRFLNVFKRRQLQIQI